RYSTDNRVIALYTKLSREELEKNTLLKEAKEEGYESGYDLGYDSGYDSGVEQERDEMIKRMLEEKIGISTIMKITGLSKEKIETYQ
ncbi:MAG: hypothetical protein HFH31_02390, partial [Bacilli bacterium]|nr:hypothetical protein [Bacilli bacterium]